MTLEELHSEKSKVSAFPLFGNIGMVAAIQVPAREKLKEHITKKPAVLICVVGEALYEDDNGKRMLLFPGKFVNIEPEIKHWVNGIVDSQLLLIK